MVTFEWPEAVDQDALQDAVNITAGSLARRYGRYGVDVNDIRQELWLWSIRKVDWVEDWLGRDDPDQQRMGYAALTKSLRRAGERWCRKEKASSLGYETRDEVFYDEGMLKSWLAVRANGVGVLMDQVQAGKIRSFKAANEGWNVEATVVDLDRALAALEPEQAWILTELYGNDIDAQVVGETLGITRQAVEARAHRALGRMIEFLGGRSPW